MTQSDPDDSPRAVPPSRYCLMVSQSTAKMCKRKSTWWVSYFSDYGSAAKATCDQHLASAIRVVQRQAGGGVDQKLPTVYEVCV